MGSEELSIIGGMKEDMKEVKETLKEVLKSLNSMNERFIANEKDVERMISEYVRLNSEYKTDITAVKIQVREQDDLIWHEIRRCQEKCSGARKDCEEDYDSKIEKAVSQAKKDIKGWLAFAILSALGAIGFSVVSKIIQGVIK